MRSTISPRCGIVAGISVFKLHVGRLGVGEVREIELGVREHGPRRALQLRLDRRRARDDRLRDVARAREVVERVQLLGGVGLHGRRLLVRRIGRRETQLAVDAGCGATRACAAPSSRASSFAYASSAA